MDFLDMCGIFFFVKEKSLENLKKPAHPGTVFMQDILIPMGLSIEEAAKIMGIRCKTLSEFVHGRISCSVQMAMRIAYFTKTSAENWLAIQNKLDIWKACENAVFSEPSYKFNTLE